MNKQEFIDAVKAAPEWPTAHFCRELVVIGGRMIPQRQAYQIYHGGSTVMTSPEWRQDLHAMGFEIITHHPEESFAYTPRAHVHASPVDPSAASDHGSFRQKSDALLQQQLKLMAEFIYDQTNNDGYGEIITRDQIEAEFGKTYLNYRALQAELRSYSMSVWVVRPSNYIGLIPISAQAQDFIDEHL